MKTGNRSLAIAVFLAPLTFAGCSYCEQKTIGVKKGDALAWESIPMGVDEAEFRRTCRDQAHLNFPDMREKLIVERAAGGHSIVNCVLTTTEERSSTLIEVRGEFVDHHLARLSYLFAAGERARLTDELESRFDKGLTATFEELTPFEKVSREYRVWRFDNAVWTFYQMEEGTVALVQYDLKTIGQLPESAPASKRGKPVSLEDLGIGKLDLNAPDPKIDLPDSGAI
jgi:hypothetical protein